MNVFIDTNILLDVLAHREPFYTDSAQVWTLAETGKITGSISTLSLSNLFYLMSRLKGQQTARKALSILRDIFKLLPLDVQIANQAIDSEIRDFEDAIQFFSAIRSGATTLLTRNSTDFPGRGIAIQSPAEFLATHWSEKKVKREED
jgi:predicted nucleic acid-binding protein